MRYNKREDFLAKISDLKEKVNKAETELARYERELVEYDKDNLYNAVSKTGLTVDLAIKFFAENQPKIELPSVVEKSPENKPVQQSPENKPVQQSPENKPVQQSTENKPFQPTNNQFNKPQQEVKK
jgi:hypothetical protein